MKPNGLSNLQVSFTFAFQKLKLDSPEVVLGGVKPKAALIHNREFFHGSRLSTDILGYRLGDGKCQVYPKELHEGECMALRYLSIIHCGHNGEVILTNREMQNHIWFT